MTGSDIEGALGWQEVKGRAFDIITAKDVEDFEKNSWMDVKAGKLHNPAMPAFIGT